MIPWQFLGSSVVCGPSKADWAHNYHHYFLGQVTLRQSLISLKNIQYESWIQGSSYVGSSVVCGPSIAPAGPTSSRSGPQQPTTGMEVRSPETPTVSFPGQSATKLELHKDQMMQNLFTLLWYLPSRIVLWILCSTDLDIQAGRKVLRVRSFVSFKTDVRNDASKNSYQCSKEYHNSICCIHPTKKKNSNSKSALMSILSTLTFSIVPIWPGAGY